MATKAKTKKVLIGYCSVDSGQLLICDPSYIKDDFNDSKNESGHTIYEHKKDKSLWQFNYEQPSTRPDVNAFPGKYDTVIPQYGKSPNDLIESGEFVESNVDTMPNTKEGALTYDGIRKSLKKTLFGQLKHELGHVGAGVAFNPGFGDGNYAVYAEIQKYDDWGERVKRIVIECIDDEEV